MANIAVRTAAHVHPGGVASRQAKGALGTAGLGSGSASAPVAHGEAADVGKLSSVASGAVARGSHDGDLPGCALSFKK